MVDMERTRVAGTLFPLFRQALDGPTRCPGLDPKAVWRFHVGWESAGFGPQSPVPGPKPSPKGGDQVPSWWRFISCLWAAISLAPFPDLHAQEERGGPRVEVTTQAGSFVLEVDTLKAPVTARNFLHYVDGGFYDGGSFYRTVTPENQPGDSIRIEVIQAGIDEDRRGETLPPIPLERTSGTDLRHTDAAVSMARDGPDTAVASFFICVGNQPELDFGGRRNPDGQGFAAFGRVVEGMDVVRAINASPAEGQSLTPAILILSVRRVPDSDRGW